MTELNPNHGVVIEMREQYHKLLAFMIWRHYRKNGYSVEVATITSADLDAFVAAHPDGINLVVKPNDRTLVLMVVDDEEGKRLAKEAGGLPS